MENKNFVRITIQEHRPSKQTYQTSMINFFAKTTIENLIDKLIENKKLKIPKQNIMVLYDDEDMKLETIISQIQNEENTKIVLRVVYSDIEQSDYISGIASGKQLKEPSKNLKNMPQIRQGVSEIILTKDKYKKSAQPGHFIQKQQTITVSLTLADGQKQFQIAFQCNDTDCYADLQQKLIALFFQNWQYYDHANQRARVFINNQPLIKKNKAFRLMSNVIVKGVVNIKIQRLFAGG